MEDACIQLSTTAYIINMIILCSATNTHLTSTYRSSIMIGWLVIIAYRIYCEVNVHYSAHWSDGAYHDFLLHMNILSTVRDRNPFIMNIVCRCLSSSSAAMDISCQVDARNPLQMNTLSECLSESSTANEPILNGA